MPFTCLPSSRSQGGYPGHELETQAIVDHREAAGGKRQPSADKPPRRALLPRQANAPAQSLEAETPSDTVELAVAQRANQVTPDCDLVPVAARKALLCQAYRSADRARRGLQRRNRRAKARRAPRATRRRSSQVAPSAATCWSRIEIRADRKRDALPALASSKRRSSTMPPIGPSPAASMSGSLR